MTSHNQQYEELSLTSVAGLQTVFRNVQTLYQRGLAAEAEVMIPGHSTVSKIFHASYHVVRSKIEQLIASVESGVLLATNDATQLQTEYDAFVTAETNIRTYQAPLDVVVPVVPVTITPAPPAPPALPATPEPPEPSSLPAIERAVPPASPVDEVVSIPIRTSTKLHIVPAEPVLIPLTEPKKKKRRRKKKTGLTDVSNHSPASTSQPKPPSSGGVRQWEAIRSSEVEAKKLYHEIVHDQELYNGTEWILAAKDLLQELALIVKESRELVTGSDVTHSAEKLSYYRTLAETAVAEMRALVVHVGVLRPTTTQSDDTVTVPINTAVVVSATDTEEIDDFPNVSFVPSTITASKPKNTIQRSVPKQLVTLTRPEAIHKPFSLTTSYLTAPRYQTHISTHYSSNEAFERLLDASVTTLEAQTIDGIERWLGDTPASAFHYVKDMTLSEFSTLSRKKYEEIVATLRAENIKYETFLVWRDLFDEMSMAVSLSATATFGQLFAIFMIEEDIASLEMNE